MNATRAGFVFVNQCLLFCCFTTHQSSVRGVFQVCAKEKNGSVHPTGWLDHGVSLGAYAGGNRLFLGTSRRGNEEYVVIDQISLAEERYILIVEALGAAIWCQ